MWRALMSSKYLILIFDENAARLVAVDLILINLILPAIILQRRHQEEIIRFINLWRIREHVNLSVFYHPHLQFTLEFSINCCFRTLWMILGT